MEALADPMEGAGGRHILAVSELNEILRGLIEDSLPALWVQGEISNFSRPASGHWYFTLKDARAQIRCAMFRKANFNIRPQPRDGDAVLLRARAGVYPARGELQLIVEHLEPAGTGALLRAFEELKTRLAAEGLFDPALKRPIPEVPSRIGVITSGTGAALQDVLTALARRWPMAEVLLYPVPVQGAEAPPAIVRALQDLPRRAGGRVDVVLLVRGGGSIEDLWAFNSESVARAIRASTVPVVVGVGHEVDVTIADFAADLRAATPTAAAELATPDIAERRGHLRQMADELADAIQNRLVKAAGALERSQARLKVQHPERRLQDRARRLDELDERLRHSLTAPMRARGQRLAGLGQRLMRSSPATVLPLRRSAVEAQFQRLGSQLRATLAQRRAHWQRSEALLGSLNPQSVLERGYAIVRDASGAVLTEAAAAQPGDLLRIRLAHGELDAQIPRPVSQGTLF